MTVLVWFFYTLCIMFPAGLITFRETLEAALVVGIVLSFLVKTQQHVFTKYVWYGVDVGILIAALLALGLQMFFGGLTGKTEELFEGVLMFVTAGFLTWMILWVHRQKDIAKKIKDTVAVHAQNNYKWGIFFLVATSVFREGTETVLYLTASSRTGMSGQLVGGAIGIVAALGIAYAIFAWALRVRLTTVFTLTNIFLLLFAAGLTAHGVHEFQEAGLLPIYGFDPLINISHILNHKEGVGSFLRILFGYTSKPTLLEIVSYISYVGFILWFERISRTILLRPKTTK